MTYVQGKVNKGKGFAGIILFGTSLLGWVFVVVPRVNQFMASFGVPFQIPTDTNTTWGVGIIVGFLLWLLYIWIFGFFGPGVQVHSVGGRK